MMKLLSVSVGGTKVGGLQSFASSVMTTHGYTPTIITGVSAGAILALPLALGKHNEMEAILTDLTLKDIFDVSPVKKKGGISVKAIMRAISGRNSFGKMGIRELLSSLVDEAEFEAYKKNKKSPRVFIQSVDFKTGSRVINEVKDLSYDLWIEYTVASGSIPGFVEPVNLNGQILFDGGVRNASLAAWVMELYKPSHTVSIYSRPQDLSSVSDPSWKAGNVIAPITRALEIMMYEISKSDEEEERLIADKYALRLQQGFLPVVMKGMFDVDKKRLSKLYEAGINQAHLMFKK